MNTQFKKGILDLCILKVVQNKEMYGFEIIDKLSNILDINENTIYPILRRLTEQELFTTYTKDSPLGAQRKYYKITKKGEEKLSSYTDEWNEFIKNVNFILEGNDNE
ncbi:PadR family transcriptional regulator [Acholeplasma granularum]|uniref:PadR family transcriptional regulator n=1 Tax=Acholeplasma granularum TaxID=264635 RepID=UPI0004701F03|nr:PadR family transcriptional regulator [Acholeplasma granularum]